MTSADHQHEKWQVRTAPDGTLYCAACGDSVAQNERPSEGAAMTTAADVENAWIKYRVEAKDAEFGTFIEHRAFNRYFAVVQAYRKEHAS